MNFVKKSVNQEPIVDTVFVIVDAAKKAKEKLGEDAIVDATIGSLYNEEGQLVAFDTVFDSLKSLDNKVLAKYAASFTGNPDFKAKVIDWVLQDNSSLYKEVIATPGGTGAVGMVVQECLEAGQTLVIPEIAWGSYALMAQMEGVEVAKYSLFEGDHFNLDSFKEACLAVMAKQDRLVVIINDPCHNPTGYSLSMDEWKRIVDFLNECSKTHSVVLLNDIAYIDYSYQGDQAKAYFRVFDSISDQVVVVVAFSLSKSMTSYGLRCGAAIIMAKQAEAVEQVKTVFEKDARATWSNINNGAMAMFVDVMDNKMDAYLAEKEKYIALLKERSQIFVEEADAVGLDHYPYKEGFFVTLKMDNDLRDRFHQAMMDENIFTVKVNQGIRVAVCSLSVEKTKGLAKRMKEILDPIKNEHYEKV